MAEPYWATLYTYVLHSDAEGIEMLVKERSQLNMANLVALAFHKNTKLKEEEARFTAKLGTSADDIESILERARRMDAQLRNIPGFFMPETS